MNGEIIEQQEKNSDLLSQDEKKLLEKLKQDPSKLDIDFLRQKIDIIENDQEKIHLQKIIDKITATKIVENFIKTQIDSKISNDEINNVSKEMGIERFIKLSEYISKGENLGKIKDKINDFIEQIKLKEENLKINQGKENLKQQEKENLDLHRNMFKTLSELKSKYALEFKQNDYEGKKAQKIQELKSNPDLQKRLQASGLDLEKAADMIVGKEILTQLKSQGKIDKADESTLNQFLSSYSQLDKALGILPTNIVNISSNNSILDNKGVKDMMAQKNIQLDMNSDKWKDVLEKFSGKKFDKIPDEEKQNLMGQIDGFVNVDANQAGFKAQLNGLTRYFQQNMEKGTLGDLKFDADSVDAQMDSNKNWLSTSMSIIADGVNGNMKFDKDGNVFVTDLLDDKSGNFKSGERKLNTFFRIPDVKEFTKAAQSVDVLELAKSAKDPQDLRAKYNQLLQEKFEQINKKYHDNLGSAEVRYEIERFKNARKGIDVYSPKSELFDYPPKAISKDKNPQLFEYMGVVRDSYDYYGANDLQQISKLLQDIKKYVQEKNLKHPFNEYNPPVSGEQTFMELVREISVNVGGKNIFDKFKLDAYLKDLIGESEYVSGEEDFSQSILGKVSDVVSSV